MGSRSVSIGLSLTWALSVRAGNRGLLLPAGKPLRRDKIGAWHRPPPDLCRASARGRLSHLPNIGRRAEVILRVAECDVRAAYRRQQLRRLVDSKLIGLLATLVTERPSARATVKLS